MKDFKRLIFGFAFFMLVILAVFLVMIAGVDEDRDIITYNDSLHLIQNELEHGEAEEEVESKYNCSIIFSKAIENDEIAECYKRGDLVLDLTLSGEYAGKVAFPADYDKIDQVKDRSRFVFIILWAVIFLGAALLFYMIYKYYFRPIKILEKFCNTIARGNLDEALPMEKTNMFESFIAAFDLMREELKDSKAREVEAEKARKELVTDLSHDIKTPVSVIKAACEMLELRYQRQLFDVKKNAPDTQEEKDLEDTLSKINVISDKAETINSLMSNVMHYTLEELQELKVNAKEENSDEVMNIFSKLINYGHIVMENEIKPCILKMDKLRLEQAIDNVVGNSYKYANTDVHVSFSEAENDYIKIQIRDEGPGVKEEDLPLICEKYYRGSNSDNQTGYGLGLFLVKWYMDQMGGGMEYYNDNGFVVELFLKKA